MGRSLDDEPRALAQSALQPREALSRWVNVHHRPDVGGRVERVADDQSLRRGAEALQEIVVDRLVDEDPRRRGARLALVVEHPFDDDVDGEIEIGVGEDHDRVLAAEFHRREVSARRRCAAPAGRSPSRP